MTGARPRHDDQVPAIRVTGLSYTYPDGTRAVQDVSLQVAAGEAVALLGANGAGKTTLVLHLNGLLTPQTGSVHISGVPVGRRMLPEVRRRVGLVFQDPDDQLFMPTVFDDVAFGPRNAGLDESEVRDRVAAALAEVGMQEVADRPPHHLSLGQRRRVAIATVLASRPDVLVLDEPSSNLDPVARRELAEILAGLDCAVLLVTHDLPFAWQLCPRSVAMSAGEVVADGPTAEVLGDAEVMARCRLELPWGFAAPTAGSGGDGPGNASVGAGGDDAVP